MCVPAAYVHLYTLANAIGIARGALRFNFAGFVVVGVYFPLSIFYFRTLIEYLAAIIYFKHDFKHDVLEIR